MVNLEELKYRLRALTVFEDLRNDPVIDSLCAFLFWIGENDSQAEQIEFYSSFVSAIFKSESGHLGRHIESICCDCENVYVKQIGCGKTPNEHIVSAAKAELQTLQMVAELGELKTAVAENTNVEEELGDLLFAAVKIARFFQIDAETALAGTCEKFIRRFSGVEAAVNAQGKQMSDLDVSELMTYWNREKHPEKE